MLNFILLEDAGNPFSPMIMIVLLIAIFYFFMIRPQNKRQKKIREERESLQKGSSVITAGGIYGKVVEVKEKAFVIKVSDNVKITVDKNCIYAATDPEAAIQDAQANKQ